MDPGKWFEKYYEDEEAQTAYKPQDWLREPDKKGAARTKRRSD